MLICSKLKIITRVAREKLMYTKEKIKDDLRALGAPVGVPVIVHTALRLVGEVEGGGEGLLDALIEYFTEDGGLLCIPTHTWANLGKEKPTLDLLSPESNLGAMPTIALKDGRGIRSENPTHSMVVFGERERAEKFIENDARVKTPTAPESCYGRIYDEGGAVLLLGVAQNKNTFLHCVDEILKTPNRMDSKPCGATVRTRDGKISEKEFYIYYTDYTDDISWRFTKFDTAFKYCGCVREGFVGDAPSAICDAVGMLECVKHIYERGGGADPLEGEEPIPPAWYSK